MTSLERAGFHYTPWRWWFAWRPVRLSDEGRWVWLKRVWRRQEHPRYLTLASGYFYIDQYHEPSCEMEEMAFL